MPWRRQRRHDEPSEIAPGVLCLGPHGLTQTNVYLVSGGTGWVLVDAGWPGDGPRIREAAAAEFGAGLRADAIVLTHDHPDHEGAALQLALQWGCPVYLHPLEMPIALRDFEAMHAYAGPLDRFVILPLMRLLSRRRREALFARSTLREVAQELDDSRQVPHLPGWRWLPTPGHTPGHIALFRDSDRVLLSGDALATVRLNSPVAMVLRWPWLSEPPWYTTWSRTSARESIATMADLEPTVIGGGHGRPVSGRHTAAALRAFAEQLSRH